jgi:DNA invertase Pin-like site-specific DNA recombinase
MNVLLTIKVQAPGKEGFFMRVITKLEPVNQSLPTRKRVAAYARVSSGKDAQLQSLSAQISYYSAYIQRHGDWEYCGVYADEALTGTKEERPEFQRLLADCRNGKLDMVITKSISRFARNTVTMLETVRELKRLGVDVYFEKENIHSISGDGEVMLTILASYAQEESRSASENCKWRIRKRFEKGESVGFTAMYGYDIKKGVVTVNEEQAAVVRMIFEDYLGGMGANRIAGKLNRQGIPAYNGGRWNFTTLLQLMKNERLTGNAVLQKKFTADHLTKRRVRNIGQLPRYYAEGTHPAIISMDTFEKAQKIISERAEYYAASEGTKKRTYPFTGKILCENCGKHYKRKSANGRHFWQCATFLQWGKDFCNKSKQVPEEILETLAAEFGGMESIAEIRVPEANQLVFVLTDGSNHERMWQDRSRSESWTAEMRQTARERQLKFAEERRREK